jgi:addiction module HigA family antidote
MRASESESDMNNHDDKMLGPVTPGEILEEEFLKPLSISRYRLHKATGLRIDAISAIIRGRRAITAEVALRLAKALGTTPEFWMNLQSLHDLETARFDPATIDRIQNVHPLVA